MGNEVDLIPDVGVAGIHRLMNQRDRLTSARVAIVAAGMEGALPSVVGGMVLPVIAVPTSVGYGASFNGLAALLGMLNSCASNVTVVNIDNGFGAGYVASLINRLVKNTYLLRPGLLFTPLGCLAQRPDPATIQQWQSRKYGMFIHFGLYFRWAVSGKANSIRATTANRLQRTRTSRKPNMGRWPRFNPDNGTRMRWCNWR